MGWIKNIFSKSSAKVIESTGNALDELFTSKEELALSSNDKDKIKSLFKTGIMQLENEASKVIEDNITARHTNDMKSDSWLSKNIRPLALSFLTVSTVLLAYLTIFILDADKVELVEPWVGLLQMLLIVVYGFYFGSRGAEKIQSIRRKNEVKK